VKPVIGITCDINDNFYRLRQEYISAVEKAGGVPIIIAPQNPPSPPFSKGGIENAADLIDGLLLSGGGDVYPEYYGEDISVPHECLNFASKQRIGFELDLFQEVAKRQKPVLAICLGMQLVNIAYGGSLYQDIGLQVDNALDHRKEHKIRIIEPSACITPGTVPILRLHSVSPVNRDSPLFVNSTHHQAVKKLGDGLEVFAMSEDGIIEGFYKKEYPFLYCVQWHPERSLELTDTEKDSETEKYDKLSLWLFEIFINKARSPQNGC